MVVITDVGTDISVPMSVAEIQICEFIKNSTFVQFVLGNHLLFVENSDIMIDVKNIYFYEVENGCKL